MANLLVTLMDKMDVPVERIGGSTGKLRDRHASRCRWPGTPRRLSMSIVLAIAAVAAAQERPAADRGGEECRSRRRCAR